MSRRNVFLLAPLLVACTGTGGGGGHPDGGADGGNSGDAGRGGGDAGSDGGSDAGGTCDFVPSGTPYSLAFIDSSPYGTCACGNMTCTQTVYGSAYVVTTDYSQSCSNPSFIPSYSTQPVSHDVTFAFNFPDRCKAQGVTIPFSQFTACGFGGGVDNGYPLNPLPCTPLSDTWTCTDGTATVSMVSPTEIQGSYTVTGTDGMNSRTLSGMFDAQHCAALQPP